MLAIDSYIPQRALYWEPPALVPKREVSPALRREVDARGGDFTFYQSQAHGSNGGGPAALFELAIDSFGEACFSVIRLTSKEDDLEPQIDVELTWISATDVAAAFEAGYRALVRAGLLD